ncbi:hypothetical protein B1M_14491 [Burkholderia sp. TJI49]|nr:hypothetical protein B1M_14491 [Burkholderia sp. TJI49]
MIDSSDVAEQVLLVEAACAAGRRMRALDGNSEPLF